MKFVNDAPLFKISRITGPKHNFLGLQFGQAPLLGEPIVERLSLFGAERESLSDKDVVDQVKLGLAEARGFCKGAYWLKKIQYVPTDSLPVEIYKELTMEIIRRIECAE